MESIIFDKSIVESAIRAINRIEETRYSEQLHEWKLDMIEDPENPYMPLVMRNIVRALYAYGSEMAEVLDLEVESFIRTHYSERLHRYECVILPLLSSLKERYPDNLSVRMLNLFYHDPGSAFADDSIYEELIKLKNQLDG